nr:AMP-binding protein [Oceanicoccus sp. KOV_DT_Chl]
MAAIGMQSIGGILVPLINRLQGHEAADILRRSSARVLLTFPRLENGSPLEMLAAHELPSLKHQVLLQDVDDRALSWEAFLALGDVVSDLQLQQRIDQVSPDDIMDMLFTSGTTGKPKGVLCNHRQNIQVFTIWGNTVGLRPEDNYLIINPFFHSFGYKAGWLAAIIKGCKIIPARAFDREQVMAQIERDKITVMPGVPSMFEMILNDPQRANYDLSSLRVCTTGGAAVPVKLVEDMRNELGFETVVTAYGLTESTGMVSICRPEDDADIIAGTCGRALDGIEVMCVNVATAEEVPRGEEGELWVRGYNVMQGYFDMPEATAETITAEGWMRTGDIGTMDERGYIRITDRLKDMYIMNGENVYPAEVEKTLYGLAGVAQVAVIGVPKQPQGEVGMAFIVKTKSAEIDESKVQDFCAAKLARYKVPFYIKFVDALPLNASGKVLKPALKQQAQQLLGKAV